MKKLMIKLQLILGILLTSPLCLANTTYTSEREALIQEIIASNPSHNWEVTLEELLLPRTLYTLESTSTLSSRLSLYERNLVLSPHTNYTLTTSSPLGTSTLGRWFYDSPLTNANIHFAPFEVQFSLTTPNCGINRRISVETVDFKDTTPVRLLSIGDSITRMGGYVEQVQNVLPNTATVGTISYANEKIAREGRGGWTLKKYFTYIGSSDNLDSPFLFPTTVSGTHYKGNTADWKKVINASATDITYGGLQKMARGWQDTGNYLYDQNGYYISPEIGDVMVDPSLPLGTQWIEWDGSSWVPLKEQPTSFEVNFTKYMERFKAAYPNGAPTHVSILLGANDFGTYDTLLDMPGFLSYLETLIASIHNYDESIKIILCTPTLSPNENLVTSDKERYQRYNRNMKLATYYLLEKYDNDASLARHIYIAPLTLTLDTTNGFNFTTTQNLINGITTQETKATEDIHPNSLGHQQMGNTLAAVIQKFRS